MANDFDARTTPAALREHQAEIDRLLGRQLGRIRTRLWVHGTGWIVAAGIAVLVASFLLDYTLRLPAPVRVTVTLAAVAYLALGVRRRLLSPLSIRLGEKDVALAIESRFPELHQQLVSALELGRTLLARGPSGLRSESPAMVAKVVEGARARAAELPIERVLSSRRTLRVWAIAAAVAIVGAVAVLPRFDSFAVFLRRALGSSAEYPRLTHLHIELPEQERDFRIERREGEATVTLAAGADLPVLVRADGEVPREAFLIVEGGRGLPGSIAMSQRPGERFRHMFRRVQGEFSFYARGGDDDRGDLVVHVRSIEPPLVAGVEATLHFPAYTGQPDRTQSSGAIEALIGTKVTLTITTTAPVTSAELLLVQSGTRLPLDAVRIDDDSGVGRRFTGSLSVMASDQYEVHLVGTEGITNPRPASYPILALEDHPPSGRILEPGGDDVQVVLPSAQIPLRVEVGDDFGVARVELATAIGGSDRVRRQVLFEAMTPPQPQQRMLVELLQVPTLGPDGTAPQQGDAIAVEVAVFDNREPEPGHNELARRTVHVVDEIELLRRLSAHFRRVRDDVEAALAVQTERRDALEGFLENLPEPTTGSRDPQIVTLEVGQSRVVAAARRTRDGLQRAFDLSLFNGLEGGDSPHAKATVAFWLQFYRSQDRLDSRDPAFYRALAEEQRAGRIGKMEKTLDPLLDMTLRADRVVDGMAEPILRDLERASVAADRNALATVLKEVHDLQVQAVTELEALLARLDQWNEFQDVVRSARALRDSQRDLEYRTRSRSGGGK
ncbi:MAG: hypothetical protein U1F36_10255 [Planctomycetota bacterium]